MAGRCVRHEPPESGRADRRWPAIQKFCQAAQPDSSVQEEHGSQGFAWPQSDRLTLRTGALLVLNNSRHRLNSRILEKEGEGEAVMERLVNLADQADGQ